MKQFRLSFPPNICADLLAHIAERAGDDSENEALKIMIIEWFAKSSQETPVFAAKSSQDPAASANAEDEWASALDDVGLAFEELS